MSQTVAIDPEALAKLFAPWNRTDEPGVVVGVSHPTAGAWRAGYGMASLELPIANTPRIRMRIGSTSKMFTCLAVLLLQEEGKLAIDDPARRHVPELPDWADGMTLRHFMSHTSGMRCHIDLMFQTGNFARPAPADSALTYLSRQQGVNFPVGERYSYNNSGYNLLSTVVERTTGQDFVQFQDQRIFAPLGMIDTKVKRTDDEMLPNSASLHVRQADGRFERGYFGVSISGEGAMVSTVEDMLIWLKHMHRPTIGSAASWREMKTPMRLNNGRTAGYGLGLMESNHRGVQVLHHAGGVMGGVCMCLTVEDLELDVIIIANRDDTPVQTLGFDVIDACVQGLAAIAEPAAGATTQIAVGSYYCSQTASPLVVAEDEDGAISVKLHDAKLPVCAASDGGLASTLPVIDLTVTALDGDSKAVRVESRGSTDVFRRIEESDDDPKAEADRLVGDYRCDEVEARASAILDGDQVKLIMSGPYGRDIFSMRRLSPGIWTSSLGETGFGGVLEFATDGDRASGFTLSTPRTTRLPFTRAD
ncbi:MAG TPA: serine hydrolase domain-containing protein [Caulobacteraceae bacterium]|jgi:CubicO group peptidase (beta-lactamase class C family)|nr:serine hydrolase domain-containing protein [Caulobacteraceae bacterium]